MEGHWLICQEYDIISHLIFTVETFYKRKDNKSKF